MPASVAWPQPAPAVLLHRVGDIGGEVDALVELAKSARLGRKDFATARNALEEALQLAEPLGDEGRVAAVRNAAGILAWDGGAYAEALQHYQQALEIYPAQSDPSVTGLILKQHWGDAGSPRTAG